MTALPVSTVPRCLRCRGPLLPETFYPDDGPRYDALVCLLCGEETKLPPGPAASAARRLAPIVPLDAPHGYCYVCRTRQPLLAVIELGVNGHRRQVAGECATCGRRCTAWLPRLAAPAPPVPPVPPPPPPTRPAPAGAPEALEAYCMRCKGKRPMANAEADRLKNGAALVRGQCSVCATKLSRIGALAEVQ